MPARAPVSDQGGAGRGLSGWKAPRAIGSCSPWRKKRGLRGRPQAMRGRRRRDCGTKLRHWRPAGRPLTADLSARPGLMHRARDRRPTRHGRPVEASRLRPAHPGGGIRAGARSGSRCRLGLCGSVCVLEAVPPLVLLSPGWGAGLARLTRLCGSAGRGSATPALPYVCSPQDWVGWPAAVWCAQN